VTRIVVDASALAAVTYRAAQDYQGTDTLSVSVADAGAPVTGSARTRSRCRVVPSC